MIIRILISYSLIILTLLQSLIVVAEVDVFAQPEQPTLSFEYQNDFSLDTSKNSNEITSQKFTWKTDNLQECDYGCHCHIYLVGSISMTVNINYYWQRRFSLNRSVADGIVTSFFRPPKA